MTKSNTSNNVVLTAEMVAVQEQMVQLREIIESDHDVFQPLVKSLDKMAARYTRMAKRVLMQGVKEEKQIDRAVVLAKWAENRKIREDAKMVRKALRIQKLESQQAAIEEKLAVMLAK